MLSIPYPKMEIGLFLILEQAMLYQQEKFIKPFRQQLHMVHCTFVLIDSTLLIYMILYCMRTLTLLLVMGYGLDIIEKLMTQQLLSVISHLQHLCLMLECTYRKQL